MATIRKRLVQLSNVDVAKNGTAAAAATDEREGAVIVFEVGFRSSGASGLLLGVVWFLGLQLMLAGMILMLMTDVILCGFPAGATLAARGCVDEGLGFGVMRCWSGRDGDNIFKDFVEMSGEVMSAWVYVDGGVESFDYRQKSLHLHYIILSI